jgi:hypothetical protein
VDEAQDTGNQFSQFDRLRHIISTNTRTGVPSDGLHTEHMP